MVLVIPLQLAGGNIKRKRRCGVKVITRPLITDGWSSVAGSPERQVGIGIVIARDPHRSAAGFPLVAFRPGFAAGFARRGNRVPSPLLFAGLEIESGHEAANPKFAAG